MIFAAILILAVIWAALIIGLLSANRQPLIDRCGVELIAPEDFSTSGAAPIPEGKRIVYLPAPGEYRAERRTPKSAEDRTCTIDDNAASASRYEAMNFDCGPDVAGSNAASSPSAHSPEGAKKLGTAGRDRQYLILTQLLASGALRKI